MMALERLRNVLSNPQKARMLFLANPPCTVFTEEHTAERTEEHMAERTENGLANRMEYFLNYLNNGEKPFLDDLTTEQPQKALMVFNTIDFEGTNVYKSLMWRAKVIAVGLIASGKANLSP